MYLIRFNQLGGLFDFTSYLIYLSTYIDVFLFTSLIRIEGSIYYLVQ